MTATITIETLEKDASFHAYVAEPAGGNATAAILVIQEIFGVNAGIRRKCDQLAEAGYLAIAPDLFWRLEPGIELDPDIPDQFKAALGWMGKFNQDQGIRDIEATIHAARDRVGGGKVGAVGYCLGGRLAYMTAARTDADCSVSFYGVMLDSLLGEAGNIRKPLMMHIAEKQVSRAGAKCDAFEDAGAAGQLRHDLGRAARSAGLGELLQHRAEPGLALQRGEVGIAFHGQHDRKRGELPKILEGGRFIAQERGYGGEIVEVARGVRAQRECGAEGLPRGGVVLALVGGYAFTPKIEVGFGRGFGGAKRDGRERRSAGSDEHDNSAGTETREAHGAGSVLGEGRKASLARRIAVQRRRRAARSGYPKSRAARGSRG